MEEGDEFEVSIDVSGGGSSAVDAGESPVEEQEEPEEPAEFSDGEEEPLEEDLVAAEPEPLKLQGDFGDLADIMAGIDASDDDDSGDSGSDGSLDMSAYGM